MEVEAGAYFKKGDVLISTNGYQFIYDGIITKGIMGCICGMAKFGDIGFDYKLWTHVYDEDKKRHVRKAIEEEKQEIDAKDLDCLGCVRELRIDDYLSPTTLEEIAEEIKKKSK